MTTPAPSRERARSERVIRMRMSSHLPRSKVDESTADIFQLMHVSYPEMSGKRGVFLGTGAQPGIRGSAAGFALARSSSAAHLDVQLPVRVHDTLVLPIRNE